MKYWIIGYVIAIVINYMWFRKMRSSKIGWMYNSDPTWNDVFATVGLSLIFPLGWICFFAAYWEYKGWKYKIPVPKWLVLILFVGMSSCTESICSNISRYKDCVIVEKYSNFYGQKMHYGIRDLSDKVIEIEVYQGDFSKYNVGDTIK